MKRSSRRTALAAALGVALVAFAGCGGGSEGGGGGGGSAAPQPGVTATSVKIGSHQPLTGPAAPGFSEIAPAARAFFDYLNDQGGINGRRIEYVYRDDAYNPANTVRVVQQLVLQDQIFAMFGSLGTPTHTKVVQFLNAKKVPDAFVTSGCPCWDGSEYKQTFGWQPNYEIEGKILGDYIKRNLAGKKVGVFYQDDDMGQGGLAGIKAMVGDQVVAAEGYQPGNTDVVPQISALQKAGAEVVVDFTVPAYTALQTLVSFKLGYRPMLVIGNVGADPVTVGALLRAFSRGAVSDTALIEGAVSDWYLPSPTDEANPWIRLFKSVHDKYLPKAPFDMNLIYGMSGAYTFAQALQRAGRDLTREGLVAAIEKGGFTGPGVVPFRYSATQHGGYAGARITRIAGGKTVPFGDPMTTEPGDAPVEAYTEEQPAPPARGVEVS